MQRGCRLVTVMSEYTRRQNVSAGKERPPEIKKSCHTSMEDVSRRATMAAITSWSRPRCLEACLSQDVECEFTLVLSQSGRDLEVSASRPPSVNLANDASSTKSRPLCYFPTSSALANNNNHSRYFFNIRAPFPCMPTCSPVALSPSTNQPTWRTSPRDLSISTCSG